MQEITFLGQILIYSCIVKFVCTLRNQLQFMSEESKNSKKINARIMKWMEMMQKGFYKDPNLLVKRTRKGIPKAIRIKVWPQIINMRKMLKEKRMSYSKVLIQQSLDTYDINLDIPRTFSFQSQQVLRNSLFNVLKALSIEFPEVGYCQGMNFLTMRLLQIMDDDTAFYLMLHILRKHKQVYDNFRNPGYVSRQNHVFLILLESYHKKIFKQLRDHNLDPVLYTPSWFLTLFSKSLPQEKFYRFFQCFLVQGYCFMYKMALTLVKLKQKQILKNSMQQNFILVPDMNFYDDIDDDDLVQQAAKYDCSNSMIKELENQYNHKHKNQILRMQKSSQESYQKKKDEPKRGMEWTIDDYNKLEVNLIKFDQ